MLAINTAPSAPTESTVLSAPSRLAPADASHTDGRSPSGMVYGHFALSHEPLDIDTPLAQTITSLPMCQMCQPFTSSSYSRSNFVAWDTES